MLRADVRDLPCGEARVHGTVAFPQNDPRALDRRGLEAAPDLIWIPDDHLVQRNAEFVRGVSPQVLVRQEEHAFAALPRPLQRCGGIRGSADYAATLAAERFDRRRRIDIGNGYDPAEPHLLEI